MSTSTQRRLRVLPLALVMLGVLLLIVALGMNGNNTGTVPKPPTEVMNTVSRPDPGQPCNYLDYQGDPKDPDHIILWCDAGQTALVIKTKGLKQSIWKPGADKSTGNGSHDVDVRAGTHFAYYLAIVQQPDGSVDFRVWYDDQKETKDADGEVLMTESRVTMRNFTIESLAQTRALGYN